MARLKSVGDRGPRQQACWITVTTEPKADYVFQDGGREGTGTGLAMRGRCVRKFIALAEQGAEEGDTCSG